MSAITEIDVLWITAGLGCDGDTIAMTAATQPSIEELILGALPFVPKIKLHNPFLSMENGEEFMAIFHRAAAREAYTLHPGDRGFDPGRNQQRRRLLGFLRD